MESIRRILFATAGTGNDVPALTQAISIARNYRAELSALVVRPLFPENFAGHAAGFDEYLKDKNAALIRELAASLGYVGQGQAELEVAASDTPATVMIQHVLRQKFDLLVKEAEHTLSGSGYQASDMALLQKCPVPVWLSRPIQRHRNEIRIAVAIDPESSEEAGRSLSLRLLKLARSLADDCDGELRIISCWEYELEGYLRRNSWINLPAEDISSSALRAGDLHRAKLNELIAEAGIQGKNTVIHVRGMPGTLMPQIVSESQIDILVMGTVARVGIPGLIFGNTAESIAQKLGCSLLALKPAGFVSPVTA